MQLVNLTPHPITLLAPDNEHVIAPEPTPARCAVRTEQVGTIAGLPVVRQAFGELVGLPEPKADTRYIVSVVAQQAACRAGRHDCLTVADLVRDSEGRVIGARALGVCCERATL